MTAGGGISSRLQIVRPRSVAEGGDELRRWLQTLLSSLRPGAWAEVIDDLAHEAFAAGVAEVDATEGTIWVHDREGCSLVPIYNTGARSEEFVGTYSQPLGRGIISMVFEQQLSVAEDVSRRLDTHDSTLDERLGVATTALLAVPLVVKGVTIGVLSAVRLRDSSESSSPFAPDTVEVFERLAEVLRRMIEWELVQIGLGEENF